MRNYFEGWYFKVAFREGAFAFIPGLSLAGENPHSFIQVIDGVHNRSFYYSFPTDAFRYEKGRFGISIDNNQFSLDRVHLDLDDFAVDLSIKNPIRWPSSPWSPNSMGWYGYIRFMECYHGNIILDAQVDGLVNGQSFSNGHFYLEKDWGRSFPQAWIWMQSNNFTQPASFCCSIARVPFRGRVFTGFIVGLWTGGSLYRFATYTGAKIEHIGFGQSSVEIVIRQGRRRLELQALRQPGAVLASPVEGVMTGRVEETLQAKIEVRLTDRETTILEDVGQWAGLEVVRPEYLDIAEQ